MSTEPSSGASSAARSPSAAGSRRGTPGQDVPWTRLAGLAVPALLALALPVLPEIALAACAAVTVAAVAATDRRPHPGHALPPG